MLSALKKSRVDLTYSVTQQIFGTYYIPGDTVVGAVRAVGRVPGVKRPWLGHVLSTCVQTGGAMKASWKRGASKSRTGGWGGRSRQIQTMPFPVFRVPLALTVPIAWTAPSLLFPREGRQGGWFLPGSPPAGPTWVLARAIHLGQAGESVQRPLPCRT